MAPIQLTFLTFPAHLLAAFLLFARSLIVSRLNLCSIFSTETFILAIVGYFSSVLGRAAARLFSSPPP